MASSYWTPGRVSMVRLQAGYLRCPDIVKEFLEIKICEQLDAPRDDDFTTTWRQWCKENIAHIKKYRFWSTQAKEEVDDGLQIPTFKDADITFVGHLMNIIDKDNKGLSNKDKGLSDKDNKGLSNKDNKGLSDNEREGFMKMKDFRNHIAHNTSSEIETDEEFEDWFQKIEDVVEQLFDNHTVNGEMNRQKSVL